MSKRGHSQIIRMESPIGEVEDEMDNFGSNFEVYINNIPSLPHYSNNGIASNEEENQSNSNTNEYAVVHSMPHHSVSIAVPDGILQGNAIEKKRSGNNQSGGRKKSKKNYNSAKRPCAPFVGLKNCGITCHLNSILQALFHISHFKRMVWQIPEHKKKSPIQSLQRLFYRMQYGLELFASEEDNNEEVKSWSASTAEFIDSFGWNPFATLEHQEVHEMMKFLFDTLEESMESPLSSTIQQLFSGSLLNVTQVPSTGWQSTKQKDFRDLLLEVKGHYNLLNSLKKYAEPQRLTKENRINTENNGLQDGIKQSLFIELPSVLIIQLHRYEYFKKTKEFTKLNDKFTFPNELDLNHLITNTNVHNNAEKPIDQTYRIYAVLVHSGDMKNGHYYSYIRPNNGSDWFKFDDDKVTPASTEEAISHNFGHQSTGAYMLIYIRKSDESVIQTPSSIEDVPDHIRSQVEEESIEYKRSKQEKENCMTLKIALKSHLEDHAMKSFELCNFEKESEIFKVMKAYPLTHVKELCQDLFGISVAKQRFWTWSNRVNRTFRPDAPISQEDERLELENHPALETSNNCLFLEDISQSMSIASEDFSEMEDIMIFIKWYDSEKQQMSFLTTMWVKATQCFADLEQGIKEMLLLPNEQQIQLWEEVNSKAVERISEQTEISFSEFELGNGDIIIAQRMPGVGLLPTVQSYFTEVNARINVKFKPLRGNGASFSLSLSKKDSYDRIDEIVSAHLDRPPKRLRFTGHLVRFDEPKQTPIERTSTLRLRKMLLSQQEQPSDILYYELLNFPLYELETKMELYIDLRGFNTKVIETIHIILPKDSNVRQATEELRKKAKEIMEANGVDLSANSLRIMEIQNNQEIRILSSDELVIELTSRRLIVECPTNEEENMDPSLQCIIQVTHFNRVAPVYHYIGQPFRFVVSKDEKMLSIKNRLQQKLGCSKQEFDSFNTVAITYGKPTFPLLNDDVIGDKLPFTLLGIEHPIIKKAEIQPFESTVGERGPQRSTYEEIIEMVGMEDSLDLS
eukprot:TRINITY_DN7100_c0_g1_i1.p1 TRINITY_DN7100_c0_g1~~TRINITY_DN7100_c0_g1_i1.p1  ORF type:complete len:1026 (+),score=345.63 TRINITY_DN7100_c0_g1_i1:86-3163(+)